MEDRQGLRPAPQLPHEGTDSQSPIKEQNIAGMKPESDKKPVGKRLCVPIVFCADAPYGAYLSVVLQSLLDNASPAHDYHIIIFDCGIKRAELDNLALQIAPHKNFRLEIRNISAYLQENSRAFCVAAGEHLSPATYGRLLIPSLCACYNKVIYADIDMAFNCDPAALLQADLGENYIAGVVDSNIEEERLTRTSIKKYSREILGLRDDQAYINAGLLVFNSRIWRDKGLVGQCLAILAERHFKRHDQDMINFICKGKIHYLSAEWNYYCKLYRSDNETYAAKAGEAPALYHFVGSVKPWHSPANIKGALWWASARKTAAYNRFLQEALAGKAGLNAETGCFDYALFGLPVWQVKIYPKRKKYSLFGLTIAKEQANSIKQEKIFYLLGLKIFSRKLEEGRPQSL